MYVYRRPFAYASHRAGRVEWHAQPLWAFDGVAQSLEFTGNTGTVGLYPTIQGVADTLVITAFAGAIGGVINIDGVADALVITEHAGTIASYVLIPGVADALVFTGRTGVLSVTPLTIPGTSITLRAAQQNIAGRVAQKQITLRAA